MTRWSRVQDSTTRHLLAMVEGLRFAVSVHLMADGDGYVELHAVHLKTEELHIARCMVGI